MDKCFNDTYTPPSIIHQPKTKQNTFIPMLCYNPMSAETKAEMKAKQKFILENMEAVRLGEKVPGYCEAVRWIKATKVAHINKEATATKTKELIQWLKEQKDTPDLL